MQFHWFSLILSAAGLVVQECMNKWQLIGPIWWRKTGHADMKVFFTKSVQTVEISASVLCLRL
jgi:hypothetical protein